MMHCIAILPCIASIAILFVGIALTTTSTTGKGQAQCQPASSRREPPSQLCRYPAHLPSLHADSRVSGQGLGEEKLGKLRFARGVPQCLRR